MPMKVKGPAMRVALPEGTWDDARRLIGVASKPVTGVDDVNRQDIRRHLEALHWECPLHTDPEIAAAHGHPDIVSPRAMTRVWAFPAYWAGGALPEGPQPVRAPQMMFPGVGSAIVAVGTHFRYRHETYPGDRLTTTATVRRVREKTTRLGAGAFLDIDVDYTDATRRLVARETTTIFRYEPADETAGPAPRRPGPGGDAARMLPSHVLTLSRQQLVMAAAANRDFTPIHTDADAARAAGARDAFANATTIEALLERVVRDWAGLGASIVELAVAIRGFNCAGDTLRVSGQYVGRDPERGEDLLEVWIDNADSRTVVGSARVRGSNGGN